MNTSKALLVIGLSLLSVSSMAQLQRDKDEDIFYKFGAGARFRQYFFQDATAGAQPSEEDFVSSSHRAQIDLTISKGEFFKTYFRAIHRSEWGEFVTDQDNFLVQQAWGDWKVTEFLNLRFGRQAVQVGRGLVYGLNEWENSPTFYDGFTGHFDWESVEFSFYALKNQELDKVPGGSISDPEILTYILDINFKQLSDYVQLASLSLAQIESDIGQIPNTTTTVDKSSVQRFGFDLIAETNFLRSSATFNYVTGTQESALRSLNVKQLMMDLEARLLMRDWSNFNVWAGYHSDSGDEDPTDEINSQYEPLNYNFHQNAGRLDLFKFGNLQFLRTGVSASVLGTWEIGLEGFLFEKSKTNGPTHFLRTPMVDEFSSGSYLLGSDAELGTELDIWVTKTFPSGVSVELSINYFKPGQAFKLASDVSNSVALPMERSIYNVILDIGFFF